MTGSELAERHYQQWLAEQVREIRANSLVPGDVVISHTPVLITQINPNQQEDLMFNEGSTTPTTEKGKRGSKAAQRSTTGSPPTITLTPEQLQKLWQIVVGGRLVIEFDEETMTTYCHVSQESFTKALPTLLERL